MRVQSIGWHTYAIREEIADYPFYRLHVPIPKSSTQAYCGFEGVAASHCCGGDPAIRFCAPCCKAQSEAVLAEIEAEREEAQA